MPGRSYTWRNGDGEHELRLVPVPGTAGTPFPFGPPSRERRIEVADFVISHTPVTQALWTHVMGSPRADRYRPRYPATGMSWEDIHDAGGFLERLNASPILREVAGADATLRFRLPSESEWEYAARGGPQWTDGFRFSGSNDIDAVAWHGPTFGRVRRLVCRALGWNVGWKVIGRFPRIRRPTDTHEVAAKAPNQLGLYDMTGNVWEWCEDTCIDDIDLVPRDGAPFRGPGGERRLRGGCHHNWDIHSTVWWRYGIAADTRDGGCIGFRLALASERSRIG